MKSKVGVVLYFTIYLMLHEVKVGVVLYFTIYLMLHEVKGWCSSILYNHSYVA